MTDDSFMNVQQAYAQARAYGKDVARLYALEKSRRKELETTTQKLQAIFDHAPNGLVVVDNDLTIIEANPRFLALFEQTNNCAGQPLARLLPTAILLESMQAVQTGLTGLGSVEVEVTQPVSRTLLINLSRLQDEQGWVLILHDLSERKRLEGLKNEFVNIAAHELRTPLAGVMGFVGVLQEEISAVDLPLAAELMNLILQSTNRLKGIIDELVDFAATYRATGEALHITDINLNRLIQKSVSILEHQIEAKGITCHLELPDEILTIRGDQLILSEVIYHLLENAIKFNKAEGKIIVRAHCFPTAEQTGDLAILIEIEDTGIGIPQIEIDRIFDKFYQVEEHLTRAVGGLGLGLTIVQRGIERHSGRLVVTSELGQGSVFRVFLPSIKQLNDVSIDNRLDVAHQQTLAYAKDMARAVVSQRKISQKMGQVRHLGSALNEALQQLSMSTPHSHPDPHTLSHAHSLVQELLKLSEEETTPL